MFSYCQVVIFFFYLWLWVVLHHSLKIAWHNLDRIYPYKIENWFVQESTEVLTYSGSYSVVNWLISVYLAFSFIFFFTSMGGLGAGIKNVLNCVYLFMSCFPCILSVMPFSIMIKTSNWSGIVCTLLWLYTVPFVNVCHFSWFHSFWVDLLTDGWFGGPGSCTSIKRRNAWCNIPLFPSSRKKPGMPNWISAHQPAS